MRGYPLLALLLVACNGAVSLPKAPPAARSVPPPPATDPIASERLDERLVLVRWGAPLRTAPSDDAPAFRDDAWASQVELGAATPFRFVRVRGVFLELETLPAGDDEDYCATPSAGFRGLVLRVFVKTADLAPVLTKSIESRFPNDKTSVRFDEGVQVGPVDPRPAKLGYELHQVDVHGRRMIATLTRSGRLWYNDIAIDAVSRALHEEYERDPSIHAGKPLAEAMVRAVDRGWPRDRWTMKDLLGFCVITAEEADSTWAFRNALSPLLAHTVFPVPAPLENQPIPISRVVLMTEAEIEARPDLLTLFGTSRQEVRGQLAASPAAIHWSDDSRGIPLALVVARDHELLLRGASSFGSQRTLPVPGWTRLP